jgi:hypothetical protein
MPTIYEYKPLTGFYTGSRRDITNTDGAPLYWTRVPIPVIPANKFARFDGTQWTIVDGPEPSLPVDPLPTP